jgi:cyanophycinase
MGDKEMKGRRDIYNQLYMKKVLILLIIATAVLVTCCNQQKTSEKAAGKLFIIGGGEKSDAMLNELVDLAGIRTEGYMYVLPMSSSEPDSAILWAKDDFRVTGIKNIFGYNFKSGTVPLKDKLDSLRNAKLIFISGGDQSRFMNVVLNTPIMEAIHEAYKKGAVISGTSAGAAVMSKKMITGNQKKHPDSESGFTTIESDNIEITSGLSMLTNVIVDQHFIKRQRLNRLIAVSIENPDQLCIGIDESTAIIVDGDNATVTGINQVIVIRNSGGEKTIVNGLLGNNGLELSVYLPGQKFNLR